MFVLCFNFLTLLNLVASNYSLAEAIDDNGITIDLFHRDSHLSPSYNPSTTHFERLRSSFNRSFARKHSLWSKSKKSTPKPSSTIAAPLTSINGEYLMKIRMGTPPVDILGIADTGSDLTWTQCKPCKNCFKQRAPLFDPKKSKTYKRVSCKSKACDQAVSFGCDGTNGCRYRVSYGDKSYSNGDLSRETFTFGPKNGSAFPKVVFGCGHEDGGIFDPSATGIVGLGGGSLSIVNQLKKFVQRKFSYCLTSLDSNVSSKISFGAKAVVRGPKAVSTPLIKRMPDTFYFITLRGISIGGKKIEYVESNTKASRLGDGNMIIDSGTTLTFLPTELYEEVESTLAGAVKGSKRVPASQGSFNLCYELPESGVFGEALPRVVVHFTGADLELSRKSVFVEVEPGVVCLTMVPSENLGILGNLHQMNYHVGYDLVNMKLSFEPMDCSKFK